MVLCRNSFPLALSPTASHSHAEGGVGSARPTGTSGLAVARRRKQGTNPALALALAAVFLPLMRKRVQFRQLLFGEFPEQGVFQCGLGSLHRLQSTADDLFPTTVGG